MHYVHGNIDLVQYIPFFVKDHHDWIYFRSFQQIEQLPKFASSTYRWIRTVINNVDIIVTRVTSIKNIVVVKKIVTFVTVVVFIITCPPVASSFRIFSEFRHTAPMSIITTIRCAAGKRFADWYGASLSLVGHIHSSSNMCFSLLPA